MSLKKLLFVTVVFSVSMQSYAQRNYNDYNRIGITGGLNLFDISTSDLTTDSGSGIYAGFTTRGAFYNNFDLIYGIGFNSTEVGVLGRNLTDPTSTFAEQYIDYRVQSAQITLLASCNIIRHHLSIEAGPILNVSGKLKLKSDSFEDHILDGYTTLRAKDIQDITKVNFHLAGGITAGLEQFRVSAQYQYGVTNTLNKLNEAQLENTDFEGHTSLFIFSAIFYF